MNPKITIVIASFLGMGVFVSLWVSSDLGFYDLVYFLLPLFIGPFILFKYRKYKVAKCVGILSVKPVLVFLFIGLIGRSTIDELFNHYPYNIVRAVLWLLPELFLTIVFIYSFKSLIQKDKVISLFLLGDVIRWLSVFIVLYLPDPNPEPYFYPQLYILIFFAVLFPSIYAISGYFVVRRHNEIQNIISNLA